MNLFASITSIIAQRFLGYVRFIDQDHLLHLNCIFIDLTNDTFLVKNRSPC